MSVEVREVMGRVAIAVMQDAPFADIVEAMRRYGVGAVTVVDADRRPIGVVSEDDLLLKETDTARHQISIFEGRRSRAEHHKAAGVIAADLMTAPAITVTPGTPLRTAAKEMHDRRIKQLPVIDPVTGRIIGTLHQSDVLRVFTRAPEVLLAEIRALLAEPDAFTITIDKGVVTIGGTVERHSQAVQIAEEIRRVEGVVDVESEITSKTDDIVIVPPLL